MPVVRAAEPTWVIGQPSCLASRSAGRRPGSARRQDADGPKHRRNRCLFLARRLAGAPFATDRLPEIVAALTASSQVVLYSDQLFLKEAGSRVMTPWHQDKPYWVMEGEKVAVCWVPVDVVTIESGAMGYVARQPPLGDAVQTE